jgi:hypothetical protein
MKKRGRRAGLRVVSGWVGIKENVPEIRGWTPVGASLLAMDVNDNAC